MKNNHVSSNYIKLLEPEILLIIDGYIDSLFSLNQERKIRDLYQSFRNESPLFVTIKESDYLDEVLAVRLYLFLAALKTTGFVSSDNNNEMLKILYSRPRTRKLIEAISDYTEYQQQLPANDSDFQTLASRMFDRLFVSLAKLSKDAGKIKDALAEDLKQSFNEAISTLYLKHQMHSKSLVREHPRSIYHEYWFYALPAIFLLLILDASFINHLYFVFYYNNSHLAANLANNLAAPVFLIAIITCFLIFIGDCRIYSANKSTLRNERQTKSFAGHKVTGVFIITCLVAMVLGTLVFAIADRHINSRVNFVSHYTTSRDCNAHYYKNSRGVCVHYPSNNPRGATAICRDGLYSYSENKAGECSGDRGVAKWLN